ncbi:MAG: glutamate--tRNA ligase [Thermoplasmata archaeon]
MGPPGGANHLKAFPGGELVTLPVEVAARVRRLVLENALQHEGTPRAGPIVARLLATDATLRAQAAELQALVDRAVREVQGLPEGDRVAELQALGGPEPERVRPPKSETGDFPALPGAIDGKVVLRMAPFPSGALHIGHARMIYVNEYYRELYHGRLLLVFDDTVGSEEKRVEPEFFDLILQDLERAGAKPDAIFYKSDRVPQFYPWARRLIDRRAAYVCTCNAELLRSNRAAGVACPERGQNLATTLDLWERMLSGAFAPGSAVLRLKTDMADPDPAFRDRVLMRISDFDHPRVGRKYRVWPMLEFSWAVDDLELGVTHVLRGKDLMIEGRMQNYIWNVLELHGPPFIHWGILRIREAKVSKSKSYLEVKSKLYDGWADPRTWSLRSLARRGISSAAIRKFTLSFGMSLADIEVPAETLYAENRALIDGVTPRRAFVADPVRIDVTEYPEGLAEVTLDNHPDRPELGTRSVPAGPSFYLARADVAARLGTEVRLKDLINIQLPPELPPDRAVPMSAQFTSRENRRLPRFQWVGTPDAVPVDLLGIEAQHTSGIAEASLAHARPGDIYQFERVGFVRVEEDWSPGSAPVRVCFGHP